MLGTIQVYVLEAIFWIVKLVPTVVWPFKQPNNTYRHKGPNGQNVYWYKNVSVKALTPQQDTQNRAFTLKSKQSLYRMDPSSPTYSVLPSAYLAYAERGFAALAPTFTNTIGSTVLFVYVQLQRFIYLTRQKIPVYTKLADVPYRSQFEDPELLSSISILRWFSPRSAGLSPGKVPMMYDYTWPRDTSWVQITDNQTVAIRVFGQTWTHGECTPEEWRYATVGAVACLFCTSDVVMHGVHGHFLFNAVYLATHRYLHPQHPLFIFLSGTMKGAYRLVQQTGSFATGPEYGITGAFLNLPGTATLSDFIECWETSEFVRDTPIFNYATGDPCTSQQKFEVALLDIIKETCDAMVDRIYPGEDDASLSADPELGEWFEILRTHIPSIHPQLTRASLKHILYRFHASVVMHDMFHQVPPLPNMGDPTKPGNILSLFPSQYEHLAARFINDLVQDQAQTGVPFGFFWSSLFQQDQQYQSILDIAKQSIDLLHAQYEGDEDFSGVNSTIMM
jgi:hypothetical protein